ncbi:MAG: hypothetical protein GC189_12250 [Alphaproteobacteria bacterium]|nr:hypothetical protein [Alphaproteobacteria bacterium]
MTRSSNQEASSAWPPPPTPCPAGDVSWLDCGATTIESALGDVSALAAALGGQIETLERAPGFAVVEAHLPNTAVLKFKGALALAGASFSPPRRSDGVLVFILSSQPGKAAS